MITTTMIPPEPPSSGAGAGSGVTPGVAKPHVSIVSVASSKHLLATYLNRSNHATNCDFTINRLFDRTFCSTTKEY